MKDLGMNMQVITDGISREDWELVEKTAPLIAEHPQPPISEKIRIIGFMGTKMGKFKAYDGETHEQAQAVGKAANAKRWPGCHQRLPETPDQLLQLPQRNSANPSWSISTGRAD